jgi:hypothetical protein
MTFEEVVDQTLALLQRRGRVTYRTLKRQFDLDDTALADLKEELLFTHPQIVDEDGRGLVWAVETPPAPQRLASMPRHLAEKILTSRSTLPAEAARWGQAPASPAAVPMARRDV